MKIVVVSDNHGNTYYMEEIYSIHQEDTDGWFHCGDSELSETHPLFQHYRTVKGNMDFDSKMKKSRVEQIGNQTFLIAHGHLHGVKRSYEALKQEAEQFNCQYVLYGHTHIPKAEREAGTLFINPGSIAQPRDRKKGTYAVLELNSTNHTVTVSYYDKDHNKIEDLSKTFTLD